MSKQFSPKVKAEIIDRCNVGFIICNSENKVIFLNNSIINITGYTMEEIYGKYFLDLLIKDEKYKQHAQSKIQSCLNKPLIDFELSIVDKSGKSKILQLSGFSFKESDPKYILLTIIDITKQKEFEKVIESTYDNIMQSTIDLDAALKKIKEQRLVLEEYREMTQRELNVARSIQKAIIPKVFLNNEKVDIWGISIPKKEIGGDYFDFFRSDKSKLGILIADVSGHGVPSALVTTMVKVYFERYAKEDFEPRNVVANVNNEITKTLQETGFYLTAFYSILDLNSMILTSTCAGHDYAICYNPNTDEIYQLGKTEKGTIIGAFDEVEYQSSSCKLRKGFKVIFFTDGITEARNKNGDFFGVERVVDVLKAHKNITPKEHINVLLKEIDKYSEGAKVTDDRTIIMLHVKE